MDKNNTTYVNKPISIFTTIRKSKFFAMFMLQMTIIFTLLSHYITNGIAGLYCGCVMQGCFMYWALFCLLHLAHSHKYPAKYGDITWQNIKDVYKNMVQFITKFIMIPICVIVKMLNILMILIMRLSLVFAFLPFIWCVWFICKVYLNLW